MKPTTTKSATTKSATIKKPRAKKKVVVQTSTCECTCSVCPLSFIRKLFSSLVDKIKKAL